jgi:regulator of replication initiation timing
MIDDDTMIDRNLSRPTADELKATPVSVIVWYANSLEESVELRTQNEGLRRRLRRAEAALREANTQISNLKREARLIESTLKPQ